MLPEYFKFSLPTRVIHGVGVIDQLHDAMAHYGSRRVLLVTDAVLVQTCLPPLLLMPSRIICQPVEECWWRVAWSASPFPIP